MNIWYMHHYAGSTSEYKYGRPYFLSKALGETGNRCRVLCASYHHLLRQPHDQEEEVRSIFEDGVSYTWIKTPRYDGNGIRRFINMFTYSYILRFTDLVEQFDIERPDVIVVSSGHPFHFFAGRYWAKKYGAKLIFEVRDIWPLSLNLLLNLSTQHPLSLLLSWLEKKAYTQSDQVVSLLSGALPHMIKRGLEPSKFNYIPNGTQKSDRAHICPSSHANYLTLLKEQGKFILMYTGAHGVPNALEPLIRAAEIIEKKKLEDIQFVLIGEGICKKELRAYAKEKNLRNVHFLDGIPRNEIPNTLEYSDVAYLGWQDSELYSYGISPNKIFEYMLSSKPILMAGAHPNNLLDFAKAGVSIYNCEAQKIAAEIINISSFSQTRLSELGKNGKRYVEANHLYEKLASQYLDVIAKID